MKLLPFTFVILLFITSNFFCVQAELLISPTRVSFNERDRAQELVLINTGNKKTTYRLEWQQKKALSDEAADFLTASKMLRFSPKQVSLNPGERQIIKLALRKPKGLKVGEYRSHLLFRALPAAREVESNVGEMSMKLNVHLSYSLPITVRQGKIDSKAVFADYTFHYNSSQRMGTLGVELNKSGRHASFGNILAYWAPKSGESKKLIARLNAYSIYPELTESQTNLIWLNEKFEPEDGELTFVYEGTGEYRGTVFDSKTFNVTKDMFDTADKS